MSNRPGVGDALPDIALETPDGGSVRPSDFAGKKLVLFFYPKDDTPGCTKEACAFRDQYQDFQDAGAEVIGVSSDSEAAHQKFIEKYRLPFTLVADRGGQVRHARHGPHAHVVACQPLAYGRLDPQLRAMSVDPLDCG